MGQRGAARRNSWSQSSTEYDDIQDYVAEVIVRRSLQIVYQPIIDHTRNVIIGYEALSRPHFDGKAIRPDVFFRAAHACQCSTEADLLALMMSLSSIINTRAHHPQVLLFVNASSTTLTDESYVRELESLFRRGVCDPGNMVIEITEHTPYTPDSLKPVVNELRALGVRIALDDYGAGSSTTLALLELEPDFVKVDRSIISGIATSSHKQRYLSHLTHFMNSEHAVIAEGVENVDDLLAVRDTGVNVSQGYYWAQPVPIQPMLNLLDMIEMERNVLSDCVRTNDGLLHNISVIQKSQELDSLINLYHRLKRGL